MMNLADLSNAQLIRWYCAQEPTDDGSSPLLDELERAWIGPLGSTRWDGIGRDIVLVTLFIMAAVLAAHLIR